MSLDELPRAVLVVDDEPLVADVIQSALEDGGFTVMTAFDGAEAMVILELNRARNISALVTDVRMGAISGWDVAARGRELNPALCVVYVTGDSAHDWAAYGVPKSVLVGKPFAAMQIVTAVSQLLTEAASWS